MTKTKKKEKIVDLKSKSEKVTNEQLDNLQEVVNNINRFQIEVGMIETRKHAMLHNVAGLHDKLTLLQQEFEKEYGTTDINIKDGTINYKENGQADKKD